jgi:hypothetical protein
MTSSGMLHSAALVKTDVSEELSASLIRLTRIGELGTALAVTSNRRTAIFIVTAVISARLSPLGASVTISASCDSSRYWMTVNVEQ